MIPRYYKIGPTWILNFRWPLGLIHLGHHTWWKPLALFPLALWGQVRLRYWRR